MTSLKALLLALKDDIVELLKNRLALFVAGLASSGASVPGVVDSVRGFLGL